ncbi:MAG: DUF1722 domain-containing protein [Desulfovibrionaceae bacterium]|nr:DUF1722 domain-containing protein [Desulfovibrionaceae bacterium]
MKLGISRCLLGEKVRYDGGHKLDPFLRDALGRFVRWVPVCPEVECGLPAPREPMRLTGDPDRPRLLTVKTARDLSGRMTAWGREVLNRLAAEDLCGYVFKSKSPSCGLSGVKVHPGPGGRALKKGVGLWAAMFGRRFPLVPVEEEVRLLDPGRRENFIERVLALRRWQESMEAGPAGVARFHAGHRLVIMAHGPRALPVLDRLAAEAEEDRDAAREYLVRLNQALKLKATVKKNVQALTRAAGQLEGLLSPEQRAELLAAVKAYAGSATPLSVPIGLLGRYARKYGHIRLSAQAYLSPDPLEAGLRDLSQAPGAA